MAEKQVAEVIAWEYFIDINNVKAFIIQISPYYYQNEVGAFHSVTELAKYHKGKNG